MAKGGNRGGEPEDTGAERYDEELLSANWNPVLALLEWSCARTASEVARAAEPEINENDINDFLGRIYNAGGS